MPCGILSTLCISLFFIFATTQFLKWRAQRLGSHAQVTPLVEAELVTEARHSDSRAMLVACLSTTWYTWLFLVPKDTWGFPITSLTCNPLQIHGLSSAAVSVPTAVMLRWVALSMIKTVLCCELGWRQKGYGVTCTKGCQVVMKRTVWSRKPGILQKD